MHTIIMTIEYDLKINHHLTWQDFTVEKREPDPLANLKDICKNLFNKATQDIRYVQPTPTQITEDATHLAELVKKSLQLSSGDLISNNILLDILGNTSPQKIIVDLNNHDYLNSHNPWDIMRQVAEFKSSHDTSVYLSILSINVPHI